VTDGKVNSLIAPTVEVSSADPAVAEDTSLEVTHTKADQAMITSIEVGTADISAPSGNNHKSSVINFHMLFFLISELLQKYQH